MAKLFRLVFGGILVAVVGRHLALIIISLDLGRHIYDHAPGPCRLIDGIVNGSEDMQLLSDGSVLISSGMVNLMDSSLAVFHGRKGQIFLYNLKERDKVASPVKIFGKINQENFIPHGLSIWEEKRTGDVTVFVVNHGEREEQVEKFRYEPETRSLHHLASIRDPTMLMLNDLAATGDNSFYFTNAQSSSNPNKALLEHLFMLAWGSVGYYDGYSGRIVVDGLRCPSAVRLTEDRRYMYVTNVLEREIISYQRNSDNTVEEIQRIPVYTAADNIELDGSGAIWTGGHPVAYRFMQHFSDPAVPAPSHVLRIRMKNGRAIDITEVFSDSGKLIYASSVAIYHKGAMLIGSILHRMLLCEVPDHFAN